MIAAYLNVPVYAAFHEWLGRGPLLEEMWGAWKAGDRKAALAAIPDQVVDDLVLHGSPAQVQAGVQRYIDNGVTTLGAPWRSSPFGIDLRQAGPRPSADRLGGGLDFNAAVGGRGADPVGSLHLGRRIAA